MAIADIITGGYGSFSTVYAIPTRGFAVAPSTPPVDIRGFVSMRTHLVADVELQSREVTTVHLQSSN
jgi:hypothetical protein